MEPEVKKLGLKALLEKGEIAQFFDVQMKENDSAQKGQLIGSIARIADMLTQHSEGVFVEAITEKLTKAIVSVAEEISEGLANDLQTTEGSIRDLVATSDLETRKAILTDLEEKIEAAQGNIEQKVVSEIELALPTLAEAAKLTADERQELVDFASLSVESQMSDLIGAYFAESALNITEIEGFKEAVTDMIKGIEFPKDEVDFERLINLPEALDKFLNSGGKFRVRSMLDVGNWDDISDGDALVWNDSTKKLEPGAVAASITYKEGDGSPSVAATTVIYPNGTLTDNGDGSVTVDLGALGGGDMTTVTYDPAAKAEQVLTISDLSDVAYDATTWNGNTDAATKNAIRDKIEALDAAKADASHTHDHTEITDYDTELAGKTNTTAFTPTADYHVATKKYVDDNAGGTVDVVSNVAQDRILGRVTAGSGDSEELTATQVRTLINVEDGADVTDTTNVTAAGALMDSEVDADLKTLALPANTTISTFGASLVDDADAATARTTLGVDASGTDNSTDVTLAGTPDYITISGQVITRNQIDLTADVTGVLPRANISDTLDGTPDTDHSANGPQTDTFNAGATIAAGDVVYMDTSGTWQLADADATASAEKMIAIALEAGTASNPLLVALPGSFVRDDTWAWTAGDTLYLSLTAGDLSATVAATATDDVSRVIGYAVSADVIYLQPQQGVVHV